MISSVFVALFTCIIEQRNCILARLQNQCEFVLTDLTPLAPDDDVFLYRLFGFSLHASIHFRSIRCEHRTALSKKQTRAKKTIYHKELRVLRALKETDKSTLPAILIKQDRGRMAFPHRMLLPFCRSCSYIIKETLNIPKLMKDGRQVSKVRSATFYLNPLKKFGLPIAILIPLSQTLALTLIPSPKVANLLFVFFWTYGSIFWLVQIEFSCDRP